MSTVQIKTPEGSASGSVELPDHVFDVTANIALMHQQRWIDNQCPRPPHHN